MQSLKRLKRASAAVTVRLHRADLPDDWTFGDAVAIDTETLGLAVGRDRLCVVQLSRGDGDAEVVQIARGQTRAPNLERLLADPASSSSSTSAGSTWRCSAGRFGVMAGPVYCTKIASKLARTYTDRHGLKDLVKELIGVEISKQQQSSDWGDRGADRRPARLRRLRRSPSARVARQARRHAGTRGPRPLSPAPLSPTCPNGSASIWRVSARWTSFRTAILEARPHSPSNGRPAGRSG